MIDALIVTPAVIGLRQPTAARKVGELIGVHVIPRPVDDLEKIFPIAPKK